ncbi:MAG: 30S ribosome-binding factor RbfA [Acidobacteria bacterium]|nr:30S ribosome-binding factor RbfA [Acidobacteriota bacterium]
MQPYRRSQRLALQIQHEVSLILSGRVRDRRIGFVTVTGVDLSPDLRQAKIFVSSLGTEKDREATVQNLNRAARWIRHELGQRIRVRFLPEIAFHHDTSQQYGEKIDRLLDEIQEH